MDTEHTTTLHGISHEGLTVSDPAEDVRGRKVLDVAGEHLGWALASLGVLAVLVSHRRWWTWLLLPITPGLAILWFTGDFNSALAAFMAIGITVAGAVVFGWRWWPPYLVLASGVALVLLLAPDTFAAFGLLFLLVSADVAAPLIRGLCMPRVPRPHEAGA